MRRIVLVSLLAAGAAGAQQPGMGMGQMPDVRQMSGIPRPDPQVPAGTLTVRVAQGEMSRRAPPGTPVHLVALSAKGEVTLMTAPVNAEGRAEFEGLSRDGSVAYYALCLLGEDRLASEVVALPPEVGVRLMLAGRKLDADGKPVGPPVDDVLGRVPERSAPPKAGTVEVFLRGRPTGRVRVRQLGADPRVVAEADVDSDGTARLSGIAPGLDKVYIAETQVDGRSFVSAPFMMSPSAGAAELLVAYALPLLALRGGALLDDKGLDFEVQYQVLNATGLPLDTGSEGMVLPLPAGARGANVQNDMGRRIAVEPDRGVVWKGVIPPGQHDAVVRFFVPSEDGRVEFSLVSPLAVLGGSVMIENVPGMDVRSAKGPAQKRNGEDGREFMMVSDLGAEPGKTISFTVTGLPVEPAGSRRARLLVGLLVVVLFGGALAVAVWPKPDDKPADPSDLEKRRDRLYDELVVLERRRAAGKIETEQFDQRRRELVAKLVWVHRQIDEHQAVGSGKSARK